MPTPVVRDPRQNVHGWWGTLSAVEDENGVQSNHGLQLDSSDPSCLHVFLKASRDSHFISQGTALDLVEFIGSDQSEAMANLERINQDEGLGLGEEAFDLMRTDLKRVSPAKGDVRYYILRAIDDQRTTPLARVHNLTTEACFNNDHWLNSASHDIGQRSIVLGRELKKLQPKGSESLHPAD